MNMGKGDLLVQIADNIERVGWQAISVFPTEKEPITPFTYTVGFSEHDGHPEMIVLGLPPTVAHQLLYGLYERVAAGERFADGETDSNVLDGYDVRFQALPPDGVPLNWARMYYGVEELPALQIVWPDREGRFPGEDGCESRYVEIQDIELAKR